MRITEEGYHVEGNEFVYEIMYRYYNEEVSLPEPEGKLAREVPEGWKIWKNKNECWKACYERIKKERGEKYREIYLCIGQAHRCEVERERVYGGEKE